MKNRSLPYNPDVLGLSTSIFCALHCSLLPFLVGFLPLAGTAFLLNPLLEGLVIVISFFMALTSLAFTHSSLRQKGVVLCLLVIGFLLIGMSHFSGLDLSEIWFTSSGAIIIAGAHLLNWNFVKKKG